MIIQRHNYTKDVILKIHIFYWFSIDRFINEQKHTYVDGLIVWLLMKMNRVQLQVKITNQMVNETEAIIANKTQKMIH